MSYVLPTVRVVNPARPDSYITINRDDFAPSHELWPVQDEGFIPIPEPKRTVDPAERDLAAEILNRMVPASLGVPAQEWDAMAGPDRLAMLRRFEAQMSSGDELALSALTVAKANGPRGLWYVMRGRNRVSAGFRSEIEAQAEREAMGA